MVVIHVISKNSFTYSQIDYSIHQIVYKATIDNHGRKIAKAHRMLKLVAVNGAHVKVWGAEDEHITTATF